MWQVCKDVLDKLNAAFQAVIDFLSEYWPIVATLMSGPFAPLVFLATDAFGVRSALLGALDAIISAIPDKATAAYNATLALGGRLKQGAIDGVLGIGESVWNVINNIWDQWILLKLATIQSWGSQAGTWLKNAVINGVLGIGESVWGVVDNIWAQWLLPKIKSIQNWGDSVGTWLKNAVGGGVVGVGTEIWEKLTAAWNWLTTQAKNVINWGRRVGGWLVTGIATGIRNTAGRLLTAIKNYISDKIPGWMQKALKATSPSRLTMAAGENLMLGIAAGIKASAGVALTEAARQAAAVGEAMTVQGSVVGPRPGTGAAAGAGAGGGAPLVHIENVYTQEEQDARRFAAQLSATLAVRAA